MTLALLPSNPGTAKTGTIPHGGPRTAHAKAVAQDLEATFLAQMLSLAGMASQPDDFGGGPGESQFSSFLVDEYAQAIARGGGIGLAEQIFHTIQALEGD